MIVNHRQKFIFFHVPKAAGTSLRTSLLKAPGSRRPQGHGTKHLTPEEFRATLNWIQRWRIRDYFSFCFVRNPWERFGSAHRYIYSKRMAGMPQDVNEAAKMLADNASCLTGFRSLKPQINYAAGVTFVGRFENMVQDYQEICRRFDIRCDLDHLNDSGVKTVYSRAFTAKTIDIISQVYAADLEAFGYLHPPEDC